MTGHLITFPVVLSLICLVSTQILICENQTLYEGLKYSIRNDCGRFVKNQMQRPLCKNKRYQETGKEYFTIVQMIVKDEGYKHFASRATFDAWSCPPSTPPAPQTPTHTDKKDTFCLMTSAHPSYSPHNFISSSHHDKCISYLITQLQKEKKIYSISLEISHKWNSTVPLFNKSEISIQT